MIPKIIHYCWFGRGEKPKLAQKCIASWKEFCPDYEIIEWNEDNFPLDSHPYTKYCYAQKKWAFLSDYVRLWAVAQYGGVYFDTDVEVIKPIDSLLENDAFYGFESASYVNTGQGFGSTAAHETVAAMLREYDKQAAEDGMVTVIGCPTLNTRALIPLGLVLNGEKQTVSGATILPTEYLNPLNDDTGVLNITDQTHSIHWYAKSALDKKAILRSKLTRPFHRLFGTGCFQKIKRLFGR